MPPRGFGPAAPAPLRTTCPKVTPPRGEQTLGRAAAGRRERSGGRREAEAARSCAELSVASCNAQGGLRAARRFLLFLLLPLFPFPPTTFSSPAGSPAPQLSPGLQSLRQRPPRHAEGAVRGHSSRREIWGSPRAARSPRRRDPSGTKPLPGLPSPRRLPAAAGRDCPRAVNQLRGEGL